MAQEVCSKKTWSNFKILFSEEYHDLQELQKINATQAGLHRANMWIIIKENITKALENLTMPKIYAIPYYDHNQTDPQYQQDPYWTSMYPRLNKSTAGGTRGGQ